MLPYSNESKEKCVRISQKIISLQCCNLFVIVIAIAIENCTVHITLDIPQFLYQICYTIHESETIFHCSFFNLLFPFLVPKRKQIMFKIKLVEQEIWNFVAKKKTSAEI